MLDVIVELFAIGMLLAVALVGFFMLLNLRQASEERDPLAERYERAHAAAEAERRFTTRRQIKTVQRKVERRAKKIFGARRTLDNTIKKDEIVPANEETAEVDQSMVGNRA
jgi:hypothetical protein